MCVCVWGGGGGGGEGGGVTYHGWAVSPSPRENLTEHYSDFVVIE